MCAMISRRTACALIAGGMALVSVPRPVRAATGVLPVFRISTENSPEHFQTQFVQRFADRLTARLGDRLDISYHPNGELSRDRDVVDALRQGKVEMAVPGTWQLDRYAPDAAMFHLPMFYGRNMETAQAVMDAPLGQRLNDSLNASLRSEVIGGWLDLGHGSLFGAGKPIRSHDDLKGLRIRIPGSQAHVRRLQVFGATPVLIPWGELPARLDTGSVAGVLSTTATIVSAKLWEHGIVNAFLDREYLTHYVPLVRYTLWQRLPEDMRVVIRQTWQEELVEGRQAAAVAQSAAVLELVRNGVDVIEPESRSQGQWRAKLLSEQDSIASELGMDMTLVSAFQRFLNEAP